jgi:hypothetical protein
LVGLALIPAAIVVTGQSSLGEAKGDECRAKPDSSSPAGLHWYYRVDRANNRHCWYLHEQGMRVHSVVNAASHQPEPQDDAADEQVQQTRPMTGTPAAQGAAPATQANVNFAARWIDLPKSVDLNAHELIGASNGYAADPGVENGQGQLPPAWASASAVDGGVRQNARPQTNFGSISLAGAVVLALLLMSEALVRLVRSSGWNLLRRHRPAKSPRRSRPLESALDSARDDTISRHPAWAEPRSREHTGVGELRRLLQRAGTGLKPPQSFAPSRSVHRRDDANHAQAQSAFERLKSRSFTGMTWAPL